MSCQVLLDTMLILEIFGIPTPWAAHAGYGRRAYNKRQPQRDKAQWQIRSQYNQLQPISGPVRVDYTFHCPIPQGTSKVRKLQMLNGIMHPIKRPDIDNFNKFLSDVLNGIVWEDDSQVVELIARKIYSEIPKTVIKIEKMN